MKILFAVFALIACLPALSHAAPVNIATLSCEKYENELLPATATNPNADSINTVMWLFGYSVAKSGAHVMYGDALAAFGYALDGQCKNNPDQTLMTALMAVKPSSKNPMDLMTLKCSTFASRHADLVHSDAESATTIMMWLYGFAVAKSGSQMLDADAVGPFGSALLADCAKHADSSVFDSLTAMKMPKAAK